ncbi:MAG: N-6 DNA methylase [Candidatus Thiodiazotropha endolucinida]
MARSNPEFQTIHSEGGLLPADLLRRVIDRESNLAGTRPEDYGLLAGERLSEIITQSWNRLRKHWAEFHATAENLPRKEAGTGLTNDRWSLPLLRELGFGLLPTSAGPEIGGRTYAINRFFGPVPVHLIGCGLALDRRAAGQRGAAAANPHGLVQEFLNRSDAHQWAFLSNGLRLRVLRDNQALSRQSFLEFDLEAMFNGEVYSDFVLLWLVVHATRFAPREGDRPETCWLELWAQEAEGQGTRALGELRLGVERALAILGEGFTSHPKNTGLRDALRSGQVSPTELHAQLLRLVYRLIFLFVAEDRTLEGQSLLHPLNDSVAACVARERYAAHYSMGRLREMAGKIKGGRHGDLWQQFQLLVHALSGNAASDGIRIQLALPALGSFLWDPLSTPDLNDAKLTNFDLLEALRHLSYARQGKVLRPVDYKNLGAEELGGVYESLLALTPQVSGDGARFSFAEFAGNERKTSGSYYTPDSLVQCLLDSALDPVVEEAINGKSPTEAEQTILELKVCDPAVGSGHFLVGAAHRLARHLARVRALAEGESEPSPLLHQHALRDVIGRCLYGVDVNPMAAELCRVSLWLEALEPGKPLSFLDHHIRVGNSLLGTTLELIAGGLPDDAFKPIEGDDRQVCTALKRRNKQERDGRQMDLNLTMVAEERAEYDTLASRSQGIDQVQDDSLEAIGRKAEQFRRLVVSPEYRHQQRVADAWCAAFVWPKIADAPEAISTDTIRRLEADANALDDLQRDELEQLANQYQFFHWQLVFPEVFAKGGFDCVLGNPPWDSLRFNDAEFFSTTHREIAQAPTAAARKRLIAALENDDSLSFRKYLAAVRFVAGANALVRSIALFPLCGIGRVNLFALFAEKGRTLISSTGLFGLILPSGIASDDSTKLFFQDVVKKKSLVSLFDFENKGIYFPGVHSSYKFCLFTAGSGVNPTSDRASFVFFAHSMDELSDPNRCFSLSADDLALLNPSTGTCPIFRSSRDAEITKAIYRRLPVLTRSGWNLVLKRLINQSDDSDKFYWERTIEHLPLYEGKYFHHYDHRWATFSGNQDREVTPNERDDPEFRIQTRHWYPKEDVRRRFGSDWDREWAFAWRDITNATNERSFVASVVPSLAVPNTAKVIFVDEDQLTKLPVLVANFSAFVFDFVARQKIGGTHMSSFIVEQLPVLSFTKSSASCLWSLNNTLANWLVSRVVELIYTAWELELFGRDCGWVGPPFRWDEDRRFLIRCELDAAFFHLYLLGDEKGNWRPARQADTCPYNETPEQLKELIGHFPTPRDAVGYILDTFPIVRRKDEEQHGEYRTKRVILEIYDAMQEAISTGQPYQTRLDPPPGPPLGADCNFVRYADIAANPPLHIHSPLEVVRPAAVDLHTLVDGAWTRPMGDQRAETGVQLAAILKVMTDPLQARMVRLAVLLALEPRLLLPNLNDEEEATWRRLIGPEAAPLPQGTSTFITRSDQAWGAAVRNLRTNGQLIEDLQAGTWAPGDDLDRFPTDGWPDGRARMVLDVLRHHAVDTVVMTLPAELRDWVDASAA